MFFFLWALTRNTENPRDSFIVLCRITQTQPETTRAIQHAHPRPLLAHVAAKRRSHRRRACFPLYRARHQGEVPATATKRQAEFLPRPCVRQSSHCEPRFRSSDRRDACTSFCRSPTATRLQRAAATEDLLAVRGAISRSRRAGCSFRAGGGLIESRSSAQPDFLFHRFSLFPPATVNSFRGGSSSRSGDAGRCGAFVADEMPHRQ